MDSAHKLTPAMSCDMYRVMDIDLMIQAFLDKRHIYVCRIKQCFAIGSPVGKFRQVTFGKHVCNFPCQSESVCMNTGTVEEYNRVTLLDISRDESVFGFY